eukprot:Em0053g13a
MDHKDCNVVDTELGKEITAGWIINDLINVMKAKIDLKAAFHLIPVRAVDWVHLGMDRTCLPFGLCSALSLINNYADALHWIMASNYGAQLLHYLDNFLLVGPPSKDTSGTADRTNQVLVIQVLYKAIKRELLSLIGKLFFAKMAPAVRLFLCRLIDLSTTVRKLHHIEGPIHLRLTRLPLTLAMLSQMLRRLERAPLKQHDCLMIRAALALGFFSFLRVVKFTMKNRSFNPRDGMPLTANVLPLDLPTPDRATWLRCSQIHYPQFVHWCCQHCCQGRPPFRHYSEAGQMKKLSIRDIHPSPPDSPIRHQNTTAVQRSCYMPDCGSRNGPNSTTSLSMQIGNAQGVDIDTSAC